VTRLLRKLVAYSLWHIGLSTLLLVPLFGQTVQPIPSCGKPGDTICISGSGWAEPNPLCRYIFTMNGVSIAPDQQDGVYGPPATYGTVPGLPDGNHTILIQLVLDDASSTLVQQATAPFNIVSTPPNPWAADNTSGAVINYNFNAQGVCSVGPCTQIVFIQVKHVFAIATNGTMTAVKNSFWGFPASTDADFTPNLFSVDRYYGAAVPYYHDGVGAGNNVVVPALPATSQDQPNRPPSSFPAGYTGILIQFETAAFCAAGDAMGQYFGRTLWQFTQTKGQVNGTSTILSTDLNQPSANFLAAVGLWIAEPAHPYTLPTPNPPACIYN
jgi:hypothetical protein